MKKNINKIIYTVTCLMLLIDITIIFKDIIFNEGIFMEELVISFKHMAFSLACLGFIAFNFVILLFLLYIMFCKIYKIANKGYNPEKLKYIRNDLGKLTPSYVYYLINMDIDVDKCINATLLKLTCDNVLKIVNNEFTIINELKENLTGSEIYIIESLKNNRHNKDYNEEFDLSGITFKESYKQTVIKELKEIDYIKDNKQKNLIFPLTIMVTFWLVFAICAFASYFPWKDIFYKYFGPIAVGTPFLLLIIMCVGGVFSVINGNLDYKRTKKGKEKLKEVLGLKKFLFEFSNIEDIKLEELKLREFYLIYSIIFGMNDDENKRVEEIKKNSIM